MPRSNDGPCRLHSSDRNAMTRWRAGTRCGMLSRTHTHLQGRADATRGARTAGSRRTRLPRRPLPSPPARAWSRQTQSHAKLTMSRSGALLFRTFYPAASAPAHDSERGAYPQVTPLGAPTENGSVASNVLRVDARIPKRKTTLHSMGRMATRTRPTHTLRHNGEQAHCLV